jgi:hypothetical protein
MYEEFDPQAESAALIAAFDSGEPVAREAAIRALGADDAIVWWDMEPLDSDTNLALTPETMVKIESAPPAAWARHRANVEKPRRIPLGIAPSPAALAIARDEQSRYFLVVGYAAA